MHLTSFRRKSYQETLNALDEYKKKARISRVAQLTHLDEIGIPVYTAIRPLAKSLSTSQGKGYCDLSAQCSAVMESIEVFYAEECRPDLQASIDDLNSKGIRYVSPSALKKLDSDFNNQLPIKWCKASCLSNGDDIFLPFAELSMNSCLKEVVEYSPDTTGLSGGNDFNEALLHSLLEVIEREQGGEELLVMDVPNGVSELFFDKLDFQVSSFKNAFEIPCFSVSLKSKNFMENQMISDGFGCHFDKRVALNRAFTEAAQTRLTLIAGSRDDVSYYNYNNFNSDFEVLPGQISFNLIGGAPSLTIENAIKEIIEKCHILGKQIIVYVYLNEDICILKSKIVNKSDICNVED